MVCNVPPWGDVPLNFSCLCSPAKATQRLLYPQLTQGWCMLIGAGGLHEAGDEEEEAAAGVLLPSARDTGGHSNRCK